MTYKVALETRARREYRDLPTQAREQVSDAIDDLQVEPRLSGCKNSLGATSFACTPATTASFTLSMAIYILCGFIGSASVVRSVAGTKVTPQLVGLELHRRTRDLWPDLRVFHFRTRSGAGESASSSGGMPSSSQWMSARTARPSAALRVRPGLRAGGVANKHPEQDNSGFSREARSTWARLLRKIFSIDVLECPQCGGRMRIVAAIHPPDAISKILDCLGLPSRPPPIARVSHDLDADRA